MRGEAELRARLAVLDTEIAAAPSWGAAVGEMDEERREIKRALARVTLKPNVERDPARAAAIAELQRAQANVSRALDYLMGPTRHVVVDGPLTFAQKEQMVAEWVGKHYRERGLAPSPPPRGPTPAYARGVAALPLPSVLTARKWPWQREFWR